MHAIEPRRTFSLSPPPHLTLSKQADSTAQQPSTSTSKALGALAWQRRGISSLPPNATFMPNAAAATTAATATTGAWAVGAATPGKATNVKSQSPPAVSYPWPEHLRMQVAATPGGAAVPVAGAVAHTPVLAGQVSSPLPAATAVPSSTAISPMPTASAAAPAGEKSMGQAQQAGGGLAVVVSSGGGLAPPLAVSAPLTAAGNTWEQTIPPATATATPNTTASVAATSALNTSSATSAVDAVSAPAATPTPASATPPAPTALTGVERLPGIPAPPPTNPAPPPTNPGSGGAMAHRMLGATPGIAGGAGTTHASVAAIRPAAAGGGQPPSALTTATVATLQQPQLPRRKRGRPRKYPIAGDGDVGSWATDGGVSGGVSAAAGAAATPVERGYSCRVTGADGREVNADAVVVTLPLGVLKAG